MGGLVKVLIGMMTGDLGKIGEGVLSAATDAVPEEVKAPVGAFFQKVIGGLAIVAFVLIALAGQGSALYEVLGLPAEVATLIVVGVFVAGIGVTIFRKRQHPEQGLWTRYFGWYLAFGTAVMFTLLFNAVIRWPFGRLYAVVFVITIALILWRRRSSSQRAQQEAVLARFEQGEIQRPEAEHLLLAAGLKGRKLRNRLDKVTLKTTLDDFRKGTIDRQEAERRLVEAGLQGPKLSDELDETARKAIIERLLDQALDRSEAERQLEKTGLYGDDLDAYLTKWTENLIMLRYLHHEIDRGKARWLLSYVRGVTEAKANEWLDGFDRLMAMQQERKQRRGW